MYQSREEPNFLYYKKDITLDSEDTLTDVEASNPFAPKFEISREYLTSNKKDEEPIPEKKETKTYSKYKNVRRKLSANKKNFESSEEYENSTKGFENKYFRNEETLPESTRKTPERAQKLTPVLEKIDIKKTYDSGTKTELIQVPEPEKLSTIMRSPPKKFAEEEKIEIPSTIKKDMGTEMDQSVQFSFREKSMNKQVSDSFVNLGFRTPEKNQIWDDYQQIKQNYRFLKENKFELRAYTPQPRKANLNKTVSKNSLNSSTIKIANKNKRSKSSNDIRTNIKDTASTKGHLSTAETINSSSKHSTVQKEARKIIQEVPRESRPVPQRKSPPKDENTKKGSKSRFPEKKKLKEEVVLIYTPERATGFLAKSLQSSGGEDLSNISKLSPVNHQNDNQMNYSMAEVNLNCSLFDYGEFQTTKPEFKSNKKFKSPNVKRSSPSSSYKKAKPIEKVSEKIEKFQKKATNEFSPERLSTKKKPKKHESPSNNIVIVEWNENYQ